MCRSATGGKEKKKEQEKEKEREKKEKRKEEKKYHASVQPPELVGRSQRCGWMIDCTRFDKMVPYHTHTCMHPSVYLSSTHSSSSIIGCLLASPCKNPEHMQRRPTPTFLSLSLSLSLYSCSHRTYRCTTVSPHNIHPRTTNRPAAEDRRGHTRN